MCDTLNDGPDGSDEENCGPGNYSLKMKLVTYFSESFWYDQAVSDSIYLNILPQIQQNVSL